MKIYYHHVGQIGADADFPKTVFGEIPISLVRESVPNNNPIKATLLDKLANEFPSGYFNCWGVPSGAAMVINNLKVGDAVLLVESARFTGSVSAMGIVKVYFNHELHELSQALWNNDKYPYIFFFNTDELDLGWMEFIEHIGYQDNFDPRGKFYSIADGRFTEFGGPSEYVHFLLRNYSKKEFVYPEQISSSETYFEGIKEQITVNVYERNRKARQECINAHGTTCMVCGFNFVTQYGQIGKDFIHVHHIKPLAEIRTEYVVDPINDLVPVCPNCHAMLHIKEPPYSIEELRSIIQEINKKQDT